LVGGGGGPSSLVTKLFRGTSFGLWSPPFVYKFFPCLLMPAFRAHFVPPLWHSDFPVQNRVSFPALSVSSLLFAIFPGIILYFSPNPFLLAGVGAQPTPSFGFSVPPPLSHF